VISRALERLRLRMTRKRSFQVAEQEEAEAQKQSKVRKPGLHSKAENKTTKTRTKKKLPPSLPRTSLQCKEGLVVGIDEAGRGPWAGPVVAAAAAILPGGSRAKELMHGVTDSKLLNPEQREEVYKNLTSCPYVLCSTAIIDHKRIDKINILEATFEGMWKSFKSLELLAASKESKVGRILVDGNKVPPKLKGKQTEAVIGGDRTKFAIAAASVIAKVTRDHLMSKLAQQHPNYGFEAHKGYGTASHQEALKKFGVSAIHRKTFEPMKTFLTTGKWRARGRAAKR